MTGRLRLALAVAVASVPVAGAGCFPDFGIAGLAAGGSGDSSTGADVTSADGTTDSTTHDGATTDGTSDVTTGDSGTGDSGLTGTDTGTPTGDSGGTTTLDSSTVGDAGIVFIAIEGGTFDFQATDSDGGYSNLHGATATLDYTLVITKTEITVGQFQAWLDQGMPVPSGGTQLDSKYPMMVWDSSWTAYAKDLGYNDAGPSACNGPTGKGPTYGQGDARYPMNCTTWMQSLAFCAWLGARLPTDTEWRIVATGGGTETPYPWGGATPDCSYAIFDHSGGFCNWPQPAGSATNGATRNGLLDIVGSLDEWLWDFVPQGDLYTYPSAAGTDYAGPDADVLYGRQWFGGDFAMTEPALMSTAPGQTSASPTENFDSQGWRCAKSM